MDSEVLLAIISKIVGEKIASLSDVVATRRGPRGPAGLAGMDGVPGTPFVWEEHEKEIQALIKNSALKFSDLTEDEVSALRGPKGRDGKDGNDGQPGAPFKWEDHQEEIYQLIRDSALKFSDFTEEEISAIRGPKGRDGRDGIAGRDFDFSEHKEKINSLITEELKNLSPSLKLKFSDLSKDEIELLRGPRGQRGKAGRDFNFEEHREFFEGLKLKFKDLSEDEIQVLRLKFTDLTAEEINEIKLKFSDLTAEEISLIRGPRGQRGKPGATGPDGKSIRGPIGMTGPKGMDGKKGAPGINGRDGLNGKDAPVIVDVSLREYPGKEVALRLEMSDGSYIETNKIKLPSGELVQQIAIGISGGGGTGGSGSQYYFGSGVPDDSLYLDGDIYQDVLNGDQYKKITGTWVLQDNITGPAGANGTDGTDGINGVDGADGADGLSAYEVAVADGFVGTEAQWLASLVGPTGPAGGTGTELIPDVPCDPTVYVGAVVRLLKDNPTPLVMSDWLTLAGLALLESFTYDTIAVNALADSFANANALGVVEVKSSSTLCNIRPFGVTEENYFGLDVEDEYYLSDTVPGALVSYTLRPTASGSFIVKIGQPVTDKKLLISRGERREIP